MNKTSIQISISNPCQESWDKMDKTERGAFCHSCHKEVVDFSAMTDREVIEHLTRAKSGCGRFRVDQVEAPLTIPILNNGFMKWKALLLGLLPLFAAKAVMSSPHTPVLTDQKPIDNKDTAKTKPSLPEHITINGSVENEKGEPLQANIQLTDSSGNNLGHAVSTDKKGRFSLQIDKTLYKNNTPSMEVYSHGYVTKIMPLSAEPIQAYKIRIDRHAYMVGEWMY